MKQRIVNSQKQRDNSQKIKTLKTKVCLVFTSKGMREKFISDPFLYYSQRKMLLAAKKLEEKIYYQTDKLNHNESSESGGNLRLK